mmetsp:Transcript_17924/g.46819  ORF Transcript_17924/g.46819 Transcript_17924/m.46819 type:complete len:125 (+) Transcript_17924:680-1054(+)
MFVDIVRCDRVSGVAAPSVVPPIRGLGCDRDNPEAPKEAESADRVCGSRDCDSGLNPTPVATTPGPTDVVDTANVAAVALDSARAAAARCGPDCAESGRSVRAPLGLRGALLPPNAVRACLTSR